MTELADKIDALAEKATPGPWCAEVEAEPDDEVPHLYICHPKTVCDATVVGTMQNLDLSAAQSDAALIVELVNARETLTRALRDAERMREALTLAANRLHRCSVEFPTGTAQFIEYGEWAQEARQALGDNT